MEQIPDEEIENALIERLEDLANSDEEIEQRQEELHRRMGISTDDEADEESDSEGSAEAYREKLRRDRRHGASETR